MASRQMSDALRERLKRAGRCYKSPAAKKTRTDISGEPVSLPLTVDNFDDSGVGIDLSCTLGNDALNSATGKTFSPKMKASQLHCVSPAQKLPNEVTAFQRTGFSENSIKDKSPSQHSENDGNILNQSCVNKLNHVVYNKSKSSKAGQDISLSSTPEHGCTPKSSGNSKRFAPIQAPSVASLSLEKSRQRKNELSHRLEQKEETLRKLNMVKMYRTKNNLSELQSLIVKWRSVAQEALPQLCELLDEPRPSLTQLVTHLGLDHSLIGYNEEEETFSLEEI